MMLAAPVLDQLPGGSRIAVIRLRSLGDCVLTTPALAVLKRSRPDLEIGVVVEDRFAAIFEGNPDVAKLVVPSAGALRAWGPELALNLHGGTRSMAMTIGSGARFRSGFAHHRYSSLYNVPIPTAQEILGVARKVHTAEHLASAMFYLGAARCEIPPARLFAEGERGSSRTAVLHPLASAPEKTWPAACFIAVAEQLERAWGLEPGFIGGAGEDLSPFARWRVLAGRPLAEIKTLLQGASIFVGNDSGPAHMAAALQLPVVVLFGASDPQVWSPWKTPAEVIMAEGPIDGVPVERVLAALERLRVAA